MENEEKNVEYKPSEKESALLARVQRDFANASELKSKSWRHMRDMSVDDFMDLSRDLFNGYVEPADSVDDEWKSRAFKPKTRHKVIATVAQFVSSGIGLDFSAVNGKESVDRQLASVGEDLYEWSLERENFDFKLLLAYLELVISGTVHVYDEIAWDKREVKEVDNIDFATGEVKFKTKTRVDFKGCRSELVSNEEMFPGDIFEMDIQQQPFLVRRKLTSYSAAQSALSRYANWKYVIPGRSSFLVGAESTTQTERESKTSGDDDLQIVYWWSKPDDLMAIIANGVLLTPVDFAFPYPHKEYPFSKTILESFGDVRFYFGNSLPFVNQDEQKVVNDLWRLFVDASKLKNKPPLLTNNAELANTDLVAPGVIAAMGVGDKVETIPAITMGVSTSEFQVLSLAERQIDENTIDPLPAGKSPTGNPTATEVNAIVGAADKLKGFSDQFVGNLLVQHAHLRMQNLFWFLTHDDDYVKVVRDRVKTKGGKLGRRQIVLANAVDIPSPEEILRNEIQSEKIGEPTEYVFVDQDLINDYRFHISISPTPKPRRTSSQKLMKAMQKYQLYAANQMIDQTVNTEKLVEAMGDDPDEMVRKPEGGVPGLPQQGETLQQAPQNPAMANQMAQEEAV